VTDETRPLPPSGWYPDPEDGRYLRWWSGYQWELRRPLPVTATPVPVGRGFVRLSRAIVTLLRLTVMLLVVQLALYVWGWRMIEDAVATGDVDALEVFDRLDSVLAVLGIVGVLATGVCWMVWQYQLARSARPDELNRSPAMHAWSWAIPIAAAWLPYQNVKDLWRVHVPNITRGFLGWWWTGWLLGLVLDRIVAAKYQTVDGVAGFRSLMVLQVFVVAIGLATAVLAIRIVRILTRSGLARSADRSISQAGSPGVW